MAAPMTATQVVGQLDKWRIAHAGISGWATHNRNHKGPWGPVNGFVWHHTGVDVTDARAYAAGHLFSGDARLPGPLCHFSVGADGTVYLVGWGRTNHAGGGDPVVLRHVVEEDYTGQLHPAKGDRDGVDGNAHFYGVEIQYSGSHPMAEAQYRTALRLSAAVLDFHGWSEKSVIAHGEWSKDKWDPGQARDTIMAMPQVRADVKATLAAGPAPAAALAGPGTADRAGPGRTVEGAAEPAAVTLADAVTVAEWARARWPQDGVLSDGSVPVSTALGSGYAHARAAHEGVDALRREVAHLRAAVAELTTLVTRGS
ncbi:N-acetylmuramoyl-L-alanine amidase [Streptomyces sp. NPDC005526]|uniref:peptidoglycan recognition protein family protein n=1 Tax=Streptomyces sp. NPDC005526 TaxID=3156885 RepID=UPI0033BCF6EA